MHHLQSSLQLIVSRPDSRRVLILTTCLFLLTLLLVQNGASAWALLGFDTIPLFNRLGLVLYTLFDIQSTFTPGTLILAVLGSFLGGINMALAYTYVRVRGQTIISSGMYSGIGLLVAFLGIGCAACGTALLSLILGFFGFSAMLGVLPYEGMEVGYIGIFILCIATYSLSKKVETPNVC